jgi:hypothetical protein
MPTTLDTFASYLPAAVVRHHGAGAPAPDQPSRRPLRAALLFADISGFTAYALRDRKAAAAAFDEALRIATEIGATPLALEVLVGLARLRASNGLPEPAAELLGLALRHPASNNDVRMQIELFIDQIAGLLAPERMAAALERGGGLLLEDVVAALIRGEAG